VWDWATHKKNAVQTVASTSAETTRFGRSAMSFTKVTMTSSVIHAQASKRKAITTRRNVGSIGSSVAGTRAISDSSSVRR
jgi:hypothetical protein